MLLVCQARHFLTNWFNECVLWDVKAFGLVVGCQRKIVKHFGNKRRDCLKKHKSEIHRSNQIKPKMCVLQTGKLMVTPEKTKMMCLSWWSALFLLTVLLRHCFSTLDLNKHSVYLNPARGPTCCLLHLQSFYLKVQIWTFSFKLKFCTWSHFKYILLS